MQQFSDIQPGQRFIVDRGFGPEEHTATASSTRSTAHSVEEVWYVLTLNGDGREAYVKAAPTHPVRFLASK